MSSLTYAVICNEADGPVTVKAGLNIVDAESIRDVLNLRAMGQNFSVEPQTEPIAIKSPMRVTVTA